jgi:hypothetical protein
VAHDRGITRVLRIRKDRRAERGLWPPFFFLRGPSRC